MAQAQEPVKIRPLAAKDRAEWAALWRDYLAFYGTSVPAEVYDTTFERMLSDDPHEFSGLVAVAQGKLVGLVHYLFHRHGWKIENTCYLQDLYTAQDQRGLGIGSKLISAVYDAADAAGAPSVYWLTQSNNRQARRLYDQIGVQTDFIRYNRPA